MPPAPQINWYSLLLISLYIGLISASSIIKKRDVSGYSSLLPPSSDDLLLNYILGQAAPSNSGPQTWKRSSGLSGISRILNFNNALRTSLEKRSGGSQGTWIWMPAQGYVSVPHQEEGDAVGKNGKMMRYG